MSAESIVCRLCRTAFTDEGGCAVCAPVKKHLDVKVDEDAVPLGRAASEVMAVLRRQLQRLKIAEFGAKEYDASRGREARATSNALSKLIDATRKLQEDGEEAIGSMPFQEKLALFMEWFISLPAVYKRRVLSDMGRHDPATAGPVKPALEVVDVS